MRNKSVLIALVGTLFTSVFFIACIGRKPTVNYQYFSPTGKDTLMADTVFIKGSFLTDITTSGYRVTLSNFDTKEQYFTVTNNEVSNSYTYEYKWGPTLTSLTKVRMDLDHFNEDGKVVGNTWYYFYYQP